jgi:glycosyltransferase involved in cell wall biosynthesis
MKADESINKIDVLFLVPTLRRAGAESQVLDLVNALDNKRFSKSLVVFNSNIDQADRLDRANVTLYRFERRHKLDFSAARKIAKLIDQNGIDIVHCTLQISLFVGWLACCMAKRKPKIVVAIHSTMNMSLYVDLFERFLYRRLIRRCQNVIFVCRDQLDFWVKKYQELEEKSVVIHNGVDVTFFQRNPFLSAAEKLKSSLGIPSDAQIIICVAGFRREKNHNSLIDAFSQLDDKPYLLLAGDGEMRPAIESSVKQKGLSERVLFLGDLSDVRPALAAAHVSVLASATETFSMAMLESMAMDVPTVVTDTGGLSEAVEPGETGALVRAGDIDALRDALNEYLRDRKRLKVMGEKARSRVTVMFSKQAMVEKTGALLESILEKSAP